MSADIIQNAHSLTTGIGAGALCSGCMLFQLPCMSPPQVKFHAYEYHYKAVLPGLRIFEPQMMYSLVLGDNNKHTLMHDFWIFVRTNLATLIKVITLANSCYTLYYRPFHD